MTEERIKRKLAAILSADVKGYSRLMGDDEVSTVRTLESHRDVMAELIRAHRGRVCGALDLLSSSFRTPGRHSLRADRNGQIA